jgi:signal transduction histidine kinase
MHPSFSKSPTSMTFEDYTVFIYSCPAEFDDTVKRANFLFCLELRSEILTKNKEHRYWVNRAKRAFYNNSHQPGDIARLLSGLLTMNDNDNNSNLLERIEILKQQLSQAQRLTALGELAGTTTHEFNNVLTTILNYAKMGIRHKDSPTRDKCFEKILTACNRATRITSTILGMARNRSAGQEPTDLKQLIEDTLLLLEREMNKYRIMVEKQIQEVPQAYVNGNQIQQILMNLLINARQAMPNGGRMLIKLLYDAENDMIDLVVRDNGCGIPPEVLPKIFDSYFTTKNGPDASGKGGTGLGLSMCRDIIEAHHGRIRVDSTVGKGTAFTLKLPTAAKAAPKRPPAAPVSAPIIVPIMPTDHSPLPTTY